MNLDYSILWFDDDREFFESIDLSPIREEIASWGFVPTITPVFNADEFNNQAPYDKYDLIVVDFRLEGMPQGDTFISRLREHDLYTEIIFYSANPASDLWQSVKERQLEGIFVTNKSGIPQKVIRVARQSVRKVLDLENMRGIVMSEVGDLDALLETIFERAMGAIQEEKRKDVFKRFHEKTSEQTKVLQHSLASFKTSPSVKALLKLCDSDKRWQNFMRVKKHHPVLKDKKFGDYSKEILWPRNCLAHGKPERKGDGTFEFTFHGKKYPFSDAIGRELRQKILAFRTVLNEIATALG